MAGSNLRTKSVVLLLVAGWALSAEPAAAQFGVRIAPRRAVPVVRIDSAWQADMLSWQRFNMQTAGQISFDVALLDDVKRAAQRSAQQNARAAAYADLWIARAYANTATLREDIRPPIAARDSTNHYLRAALSKFATLDDTVGLAHTLGVVSRDVFWLRSNPELSQVLDELDPPARADSARTLNEMALNAYRAGQLDAAAAHFQRALPLWLQHRDLRGAVHTLNALGEIALARTRFDSATHYFMQAAELQHPLGSIHDIGRNNVNLAIVAFDAGQPAIAARFPASGTEALTSATLTSLSEIATGAERISAYVRLVRDMHVGIDANTQDEFARLPGNPLIGGWHNLAIAGALFVRGDLDDVARALARARPLLAQAGDTLGMATADSYQAALRAVITGSRRSTVSLAAARAELQRVQSLVPGMRQDMRADQFALAHAFADVASGYMNARPANLRSAAAYFDSAAMSFARVTLYFADDGDRIAFADQLTRLGEESTRAWLSLGNETAALGALERGRSIAFQYLRRTAPPDTGALIRNFDRANEGETPDSLSWLLSLPAERVTTELMRRVLVRPEQHALYYYVAADTLMTWLVSQQGVTMQRTPVPADRLGALVAQLRAGLNVDEAARNLEDPDPLAKLLAARSGHERTVEELSDLLLPPQLIARLPPAGEIIIMPQGVLAQVPFTALRLSGDAVLADRFSIRYGTSLTTLAIAQDNGIPRPLKSDVDARARWLRNALIVGDPVMPAARNSRGTVQQLKALPGARAEADAIAQLIGTQPMPREAATESRVTEQLRTASVVHLATHGFAYGDADEHVNSFVALTPDDADDGLLTVGELLRPDVVMEAADLVVLSACQTGLGHIAQSEGTLGLQRAFLARGARSVLVSLWSIDDAATSRMMTSFYHHWLEDEDEPSKAEALRRAQNDLRATHPNPRYWAAFQLFGAN